MIKLIKEIWGGFGFETRMVFVAGVGLLLLLAIVLGRIDSCRSRREDRKIDQIQANIKTAEIEANVLTNSSKEVEANANKANANLGNVLGTDSANRESDFGTVRQRWCADHPNDSKCR
jgi:hypothetical protein